MPALQVKDCPTDVYERLRACASQENRSIAQQALTIIEKYLEARGETPVKGASDGNPARPSYAVPIEEADYLAKRKRAFERIGMLAPLPVGPSSPAAADVLAQIREEEAR